MSSVRERARKARQTASSKVKPLLLTFSKKEPPETAPEPATKATWKHLFAFTSREHMSTLPFAIIATFASSSIRAYKAVAYGQVFDILSKFGAGKISGQEAMRDVSTWCLVLTGMGIGVWLSNSMFMHMWIVFGEGQARSVRRQVFGSLLGKDMAWYDGQADGTPSLMIQIETQTRELQLAASQPFGLVLLEFLVAVGSMALAFYSSWELTIVLLASFPISFIVIILVSKPLEPAIQAQKRCLGEASKLATASLTGIDLVKIFNGFDSETCQYFAVMRKVTAKYLVQARCNALQVGYVEFWIIAMFAGGFWYGARLVDRGVTPQEIFTTFCAVFAAFQGVDAIMPQFLVLSKGMVAGKALREMAPKLKKEEGPGGPEASYRPGKCIGDIELTDVSFAYPSNPSELVLAKSSFSFAAGELTFLVGRSGSGKSTISNLILRFYDTLTGEIRIDGHGLESLDPAWVRSNITLIQQSSILFDDTFYRNIAFGLGDPDKATAEDVKMACDVALLQSTIASLPNGMETMVGDGGYNLSGGQKQRLALARARLRDPPVLILDEVTSGLDHMSRTLVMDVIRQWRKGKTTIIITHDVAQIEEADYVYVMDKGHVVQEGYRGHLMREEDAIFASLVKSTTDEAVDEPKDEETDEILPAKSEHGDNPPEPADIEPEKTKVKKRVSFFETFGEGLLSTQIPKGTSIGQFALATRMRESQLWEENEQAGSHGSNVEAYNLQLRRSLLDHISERSAGVTGKDGRICEVLSEASPRNSGDLSFDFVEQIGWSVQASRHEDTRARRKRRQSGLTSIADLEKGGDGADTRKPGSSDWADKYGKDTSIATILGTVWPNLSKKQRLLSILGLLSCLVAAAAIPVFSYLLARLLTSFWEYNGNRLAAGQKWAIILLGVAVVDGLANFLSRYLMEHTGQSWINTLRVEALKRILRQPKAWFDTSGNTVGKINECLDRNAEEMRNLVGRFLPSVLIVAAMVVTALVWALAVSWKLTLVALSPAPLIALSVKGADYFNGKWEDKCSEGSEAASVISRQTFTNVRVVRALTLEGYFERKYEVEVAKVFTIGVRRGMYAGFFYGFQEAMTYFVAALIFYYGTEMISKRELPLSHVIEVQNLLLFSIGSSMGIMGTVPQITAARTTAVQMLNYASLPPAPPRESEGGRKVTTPFPICFSGLSFAYPSRPNQEVLRSLCLRLEAGTSTAIVGRSGCGKSTLASLLLGLYAPCPSSNENESTATLQQPGSEEKRAAVLSFGGIPWDELDAPHLRSMMSYVPQAPFLFPASIAANIAYGIPTHHPLAQRPNIETAARAAGIHTFIETLPEGYATLVGDGGLTLSGGQAQRVCIARAMARWPRVLVLDEPTSALDARSAEAVRGAIRGLVGAAGERMCVVVVTHCREMMRVMGRVVLLEGGFVIEEGGYEELVGKGAQFARLVKG